MQAYDLIMLIVLAMATIFGAIKGFAWQVASLASVVISYIVAYRFRFDVAEMIQAKPPWNQFLAMLILYVGTSFVIWVGFRLFSGMIDRVRIKEFDRHLGAAFGLAKGAIFCLLITMFAMSLLGPSQQAAICQSRSGYYISKALDHGMGVLPQELHDVVGPYLARLDEKLHNGGMDTSNTGPEAGNMDGSSGSAWPFDSNRLNEQLQRLPNPGDISELIPVPSNLATPSPSQQSPNQYPADSASNSTSSWYSGSAPPSNSFAPSPAAENPYSGSGYMGNQTTGNQTPGNQFSGGQFSGKPSSGSFYTGNAGSAAMPSSNGVQGPSSNGVQGAGSGLSFPSGNQPGGYPASGYSSGSSQPLQRAQDPNYSWPR